MAFAKRILPLIYIQKTIRGAESVWLPILGKISFFNKKLPLDLLDVSTSNAFNIAGTICLTFQPHSLEKRSNNQFITDFTKPL